ncbi:MAG TPA: hypothetical protein VFZ16_18560 [Hyphomicrobiaceae bacterium]|nr:hypothetical protein [Hyphomicrobiaceae bacterium]
MALQATAGLAALGALLSAFLGLGLGLLRLLAVRVTPVDGLYAVAAGWGAVVTASILAGYLGVPLRGVLYAGTIGGCGLLAHSLWHGHGRPAAKAAAIAALSVFPAVSAAASFGSVQYDEFGHWLPNALYLFAHDALPTAALPNLQTGKQGYPIGMPYVSFAVSSLQGAWDDRVPKVLPLVLGALLGIVLAAAWLRSDWPAAAAVAVAALCATLLNPFFDPRIAITTYADVPTAFLLAAMAYSLWRGTVAEGAQHEPTRDWTVRASLAALALVHLRETNMVLVAAAAMAVPLSAAVARGRDAAALGRACSHAAAFMVAPALGVAIWRLHLAVQGIAPDMVPRALSQWNWSAPGTVLRSLATERLANNPAMGAAALTIGLVLTACAIVGWRRMEPGTKRLTLMVAAITAAQAALLVFSYVAVFSADEVARAASVWRYASQLGPLILVAAAHLLACSRFARRAAALVAHRDKRIGGKRLGPALIVAGVLVLQALFAHRWRIDCLYPHVRPAFQALHTLLATIPPEAPVAIAIPGDADAALLGEVARLSRVLASGDWHARPPIVVAAPQLAPDRSYVIKLAGAASARLPGPAAAALRATIHGPAGAAPGAQEVLATLSCAAR